MSSSLEQLETCPLTYNQLETDCISRQAAIDGIAKLLAYHGSEGAWIDQKEALDVLKSLSSAQPEPCLYSIVSEIKKTISETEESGKYHCANIRINGEMICFGLQLALEIIEEKRNGQSDKQTGGNRCAWRSTKI